MVRLHGDIKIKMNKRVILYNGGVDYGYKS